MPHRPTDEDKKLWRYITKGIEPYHPDRGGDSEKIPMSPKEKNKDQSGIKKGPFTLPQKLVSQTPSHGPHTLDRRTETRLKRGQIQIEGRIDLHGMTQESAHNALIGFILQSCQQGKRCVLIITGKGRLSAPGKIKQNLSNWLYEYPLTGMVLRHVTARPQDGGAGAFYVYLKRQRDME